MGHNQEPKSKHLNLWSDFDKGVGTIQWDRPVFLNKYLRDNCIHKWRRVSRTLLSSLRNLAQKSRPSASIYMKYSEQQSCRESGLGSPRTGARDDRDCVVTSSGGEVSSLRDGNVLKLVVLKRLHGSE